MKTTGYVLVLLYASLGAAFPVQAPYQLNEVATAPSDLNEQIQPQRVIAIEGPECLQKPTFQQYIDRLRSGSQSIFPVNTNGFSENHRAHSEYESQSISPFRHHYGTLLGKVFPFKDDQTNTIPNARSGFEHPSISTKQRTPYLKATDLVDLIDRHRPECVALALLVLVPIAYLVLELLEMAIQSCIEERFPDRGRDRVRLMGPERQLRAWSNRQRDRLVAREKRWWHGRRAR
ncbi:uncharacterized protein N7459_000550 [Penicillium hispanicum]|uniref:uncharacterized protein n=1 Tax=Penicillium hispanicum TaxID=1080232 RepID=UPI00253FDA57|nr:uncharacterized protein N7459_000550 [Penicillium hispanicum]KAJ5594342.1 hypothetical protein N7459_000550 [Penicillium hispanicum]